MIIEKCERSFCASRRWPSQALLGPEQWSGVTTRSKPRNTHRIKAMTRREMKWKRGIDSTLIFRAVGFIRSFSFRVGGGGGKTEMEKAGCNEVVKRFAALFSISSSIIPQFLHSESCGFSARDETRRWRAKKATLGNYSYPLCVLFVSVDSFVIILLFSPARSFRCLFYFFPMFFVLHENSFCWLLSAPPDVTLRLLLPFCLLNN
jgi:hypothetical protein